MKYFFLSDSWTTGRVWEFGGLWNELAWNRKPHLQRQSLYIQEHGENLWLYQAEDAILMVEVLPKSVDNSTIGQVVLKRLLSAEQVVDKLCSEAVFHPPDVQSNSQINSLDELNTVGLSQGELKQAPSTEITQALHRQPVKKQPAKKQPVKNDLEKATKNPRNVIARLRKLASGKTAEKG